MIELHNRILLVLVGAAGCSLRKNEITVLPSSLHPLAVFEGVADGVVRGYQAGDLATPAFGQGTANEHFCNAGGHAKVAVDLERRVGVQ